MSDVRPRDPADLLDRLAPDVDVAAAHGAFRRARQRRRTRDRARLAVLVGVVSLAAVFGASVLTQDPNPQVTAGESAVEHGAGSGTFALPAPNDAESVLLADGTPVWIVHHGDGSVSAVPGMFQASMNLPPLDEQLYSPVMWDPDDRVFEVFAVRPGSDRASSWDAHGRSLTAARDLTGFIARVEENRVSILPDDSDGVPGTAQDVVRTDGARHRAPEFPPMVGIGPLAPGWHQLEADIVIDQSGRAAVCEPALQGDEPVAGTGKSHCPAGAPPVAHIDIGDYAELRLLSPLMCA